MITFADFFCGCGGLSSGFHRRAEFRGILASDAWEAAGITYSSNFQTVPFVRADVHDEVQSDKLARFLQGRCDVLIGGPPCQAFSTLGKRRDGDRRGKLVDIFVEMCLRILPKVFVMENVRGIGSMKHHSSATYPEFIRARLRTAGYETEQLLINTLEYGLPQTRIRWLLIAVRRDEAKDTDALAAIRKAIVDRASSPRATLRDAIGDLPRIEAGEGSDEIVINSGRQQKWLYNHRAMKHSVALVRRLRHVPVGGGLLDVPRRLLTDHLKRMLDGKYGNGGHPKNIYGRLDWAKPAGTIVAGMDKITCGRFVHPEAHRLLTPRECARLQGFSDSFRFYGSLVTQYYLIGNAVPPKISEILAGAIVEVGATLFPNRTKKRAAHPGTRSNRRNNRKCEVALSL